MAAVPLAVKIKCCDFAGLHEDERQFFLVALACLLYLLVELLLFNFTFEISYNFWYIGPLCVWKRPWLLCLLPCVRAS